MKLKFVEGRGYESYNSKDKKEDKQEAKAHEETQEEEEAPAFLVTHVNRIWIQFSPILRCTSTISKFTTQLDSRRTSLTFPTTSREPFVNKGVMHCQGYDYEKFPDQIIEAPLSEPFFKENEKA